MPTAYAQLYVHLVWATWDRLPILRGAVRDVAYKCIRTECEAMGAKVIALGGTENHVHLLASLPTKICIADLVKQVKGSSAHLVNHDLLRDRSFKWQGSYAAFTVSKSLGPTVRDYIQNQEQHHREGSTDKNAELAWAEQAPPVQ